MADKTIKWWQSKNVWTGVVAVIISAYATAAAQFGLPQIPEFVFGILGAVGIYTRINSQGAIK